MESGGTAQVWLKANGGFPALVLSGIPLCFAFLPLGVGFIAVGVLGWLMSRSWFPFTIIHKRGSLTTDSRRNLLSLAQAVTTELETCRYRLEEAKSLGRTWLPAQQLPAAAHNEQWTPSPLTADEVGINDALRSFYVWADQLNWKFSARAAEEEHAVGLEFTGKGRTLDEADLAELDEGIGRVQNAQALLAALIARLSAPPEGFPTAVAGLGVLAGVIVGVGVGYAVFQWKPWADGQTNRFVGKYCYEREELIKRIEESKGPFVIEEAQEELAHAAHIDPCQEEHK